MGRWRGYAFTVALGCMLALGCGGGEGGDLPPAASAPAGLVEEMRIDGAREELVPFGVSSGGSAAVAADGTVAFGQMQQSHVRFFAADGTPLGTFGRKGSGPGEFERNTRVGWYGDTLWTYDPGLQRLTLIGPDRGFIRTVALPTAATIADPAGGGEIHSPFVFPQGLTADGNLVVQLLPAAAPTALNRYFLGAMPLGGGAPRLLAVVPTGRTSVQEGGATATVPLANRTVGDVSRDGSRIGWARAGDDAEDASVAVNVVAASGDTVFVRSYPIEVIPLPPSVRDSTVEAVVSRYRTIIPEIVDEVTEAARDIAIFPPLQEMVIGRDGTVWIALANREGRRPHLVLGPDGTPLGEIALSDRSRIAEAERGRIWVIEKDELDVESLVRYAVDWGAER